MLFFTMFIKMYSIINNTNGKLRIPRVLTQCDFCRLIWMSKWRNSRLSKFSRSTRETCFYALKYILLFQWPCNVWILSPKWESGRLSKYGSTVAITSSFGWNRFPRIIFLRNENIHKSEVAKSGNDVVTIRILIYWFSR